MYKNALAHRLRKRGLRVEQQYPLAVLDEDGTVLGEYYADLLIEGCLIVELKRSKMLPTSTSLKASAICDHRESKRAF